MLLVRKTIIRPLLLVVTACACGSAQGPATAAVAPRIIIDLPDNISPASVWIRYVLDGPEGTGGKISRGGTLKAEPNSQHFIPAVFGDAPARYARVVIYAQGCKFATYDLDLGSGSDVTEHFQCVPLPTKTVHGFLNIKKTPSRTYSDKRLDVVGYLDGMWVCDFLPQQRRGATLIEAGSCLDSDIQLGTIGKTDPGSSGAFEITIPDFTRDPVFDRFAQNGKFGFIELALEDKNRERIVTTIKAADRPELGLNVQKDYSDPVQFVPVRP
jgi:hypothetical protein